MHAPATTSLCSTLLAVFVFGTATGCATTSSTGPKLYTVDERVPLTPDGIMLVSFVAGPITVTELRILNRPTEDEVFGASQFEHSRPRPAVRATSDGTAAARIDLEVSLENEQGEVLLRCNASGSLKPSGTETWTFCSGKATYTRDWPDTKVFHLKATVKPKR